VELESSNKVVRDARVEGPISATQDVDAPACTKARWCHRSWKLTAASMRKPLTSGPSNSALLGAPGSPAPPGIHAQRIERHHHESCMASGLARSPEETRRSRIDELQTVKLSVVALGPEKIADRLNIDLDSTGETEL
jgi:hypothetical protein